MLFAAELRQSLRTRHSHATDELAGGDDLQQVLTRHLLAIEAMAQGELITSILLLSGDGNHLFHGAAPRLPPSYCDVIDGSPIGPNAGSCGTAAYRRHPVYVTDIATDPLWADYRHIALPHGLRSCWSTPIEDPAGNLVGTFAIYRRTPGAPTSDEIAAIDMITEHVAKAIMMARGVQDLRRRNRPTLKLVTSETNLEPTGGRSSRLLEIAGELQMKATTLQDSASGGDAAVGPDALIAAQLSRRLAALLRAIDQSVSGL